MIATRRPNFPALLSLSTVLVCLLANPGVSEPRWPQFRGPGGLAIAADQELPDRFGPDRNVLWKKEVSLGHSSPIIWGDRLILTSTEGARASVTSYRRSDGAIQWRKNFDMKGVEPLNHRHADGASPTPCTDGKRIYAYFGGHGLITLDLAGEVLWERTFPIAPNVFGTGTSPIYHDGSVILVRDVNGISGIHCIDAATGKDRWTTGRPEVRVNYGSPFVWRNGEREELVIAGTGILKSYDLEKGKPLWWVNNVTAFVCTTPVASPEVLYFAGWSTSNVAPENRLATGFDHTSGIPQNVFENLDLFFSHLDKNADGLLQQDEIPESRMRDSFSMMDFNKNGAWDKQEIQGLMGFPTAPGNNNVLGVRAGGEGDITKSHVLFEKTKGVPYVASPLLYKNRLYYVKKGGLISCIDPKTGEPFYETQRLGVGGEYYSSPVGVGERILIGSVRGTMFVLGTGNKLEIVARNEFEEEIFATPAVVENTLYLRTAGHLYAIGGKTAGGSAE